MVKIVKPTKEEKKIIDKRLLKKYPQMYHEFSKEAYSKKPPWIDRLKIKASRYIKSRSKSKSTTKKSTETKRTKGVAKQLKRAGITESEIKRLKGKQ